MKEKQRLSVFAKVRTEYFYLKHTKKRIASESIAGMFWFGYVVGCTWEHQETFIKFYLKDLDEQNHLEQF
jgi:hypothetical protein